MKKKVKQNRGAEGEQGKIKERRKK